MVSKIKNRLRGNILTMSLLNRLAAHEVKCDKAGGHRVAAKDEIHLREAINWLVRAQDAMPYGGLSRGYSFGWNPYFPRKGWQPTHPKVTGEVIPTLFDCAIALNRGDLRQRAIELANWLVRMQLSSGAIRGGALDEPPSPEILNTAQAIVGWSRAFQETGWEQFIQAAQRASDFLIRAQDPDETHESIFFSSPRENSILHSSSVGCALIRVGILLEEYRYCAAGEKNIAHCILNQQPNGWFGDGRLKESSHLFLHTIAHIVRQILESALILDNNRYLLAAKKTADALLEQIKDDGSLRGCFANGWSEITSWSCLLGNAQMVNIWLNLHEFMGNESYLNAARRVVLFLKKTQNLNTSHLGLRGGIKGSFPCDGQFGRYQTLSSATKFFIDALLLLAQLSHPQQTIPSPSLISLPKSNEKL